MKTGRFARLALLAALILGGGGAAGAEDRGEGGERGGWGRQERSFGGGEAGQDGSSGRGEGRRIMRMRNISISRPERLEPARVVNDSRQFSAPRRFGNGDEIRVAPARVPPAYHAEIANDRGALRSMQRERGLERERDRFFWHEAGGRRYAHYLDKDDIDWYGFYFGPSFYWTRYYGDRWWWYDPAYARWVFWWNGSWWWQGPGGLDYVYMDNNYYPYQEGGITVEKAATLPPPETSPAPGTGKQWTSPDLRRLVEVAGTENAAFLYDRTSGKPVYMSYLGRDVAKVRFTGGAGEQPLRILLDFKDGAFAVFDADGKSVQPEEAVSAPPLPASLPPSAPGSTSTYTGN